jgi:hypothetical protein
MSRKMASPAYYAVPFLLAFVLSIVMLMTDTNLRTDFGALSSGYYFHWYVILVTAIADLVGAALLLVLRSRLAVKIGVAGSGLLAAVYIGAIFTYGQVGFASASDFANYLFGVTYSPGNIRYLYDVVLAVYVVAFLMGLGMLLGSRPDPKPPAQAWEASKAGSTPPTP